MFKKLLFIGLPLGVLTTLVGWLTCGNLFSWVYEINPSFIWKTAEEISVPHIWGFTILLSILLVFVFGTVKNSLIQKCRILRGLHFGLLIWIVGSLAGGVAQYLYVITAHEVILYQLAWGLVVGGLQGVFISVFYDKACPLTCCGGKCESSKKTKPKTKKKK